MDFRYFNYEVFQDGKWKQIESDKAFGILQASFGCVSPAIAAMVMNESTVSTSAGPMRLVKAD